jgi:uncharacterized protein
MFVSGIMSALLAAAGLAFVEPYWISQPVIEALGRAEIEVKPNRGQFEVSFLETEKDADDAMKAAVSRARLTYEAIKKVAGDKALVTSSVQVEPYYEQYRDKDGNLQTNYRADKIDGYEARVSVDVKVRDDMAIAGEARAAALVLGPESSTPLRTWLEETAQMNRTAYHAAVKDAAERARLSAAAAGTTLGKLLVIQEGNGPCMGSWREIGSEGGYDYAPARVPAPPPPASAPIAESFVLSGTRAVSVTITQEQVNALNLPSDPAPVTVRAGVCAVYAAGR